MIKKNRRSWVSSESYNELNNPQRETTPKGRKGKIELWGLEGTKKLVPTRNA